MVEKAGEKLNLRKPEYGFPSCQEPAAKWHPPLGEKRTCDECHRCHYDSRGIEFQITIEHSNHVEHMQRYSNHIPGLRPNYHSAALHHARTVEFIHIKCDLYKALDRS